MTNELILDDEQTQPLTRRRGLLPGWIKFFVWFFLLMGLMVPVGIISGLLGRPVGLDLYGFGTTDPFSNVGVAIMVLLGLKAAVAFGLWWERPWAPRLGVADGAIGIGVCLVSMYVFWGVAGNYMFRFELVVLAFYARRMYLIEEVWQRAGRGS